MKQLTVIPGDDAPGHSEEVQLFNPDGTPYSPGGGLRQLDYENSVPGASYDETGTSGWDQPSNGMMPVLVIVTATVVNNQGVSIDVGNSLGDQLATVDYTDVNGTQILKAEVPSGHRYRVLRNGVDSTINDIREVTRSA